jgi:hypothetical protein
MAEELNKFLPLLSDPSKKKNKNKNESKKKQGMGE